jgi:hypothetical protein
VISDEKWDRFQEQYGVDGYTSSVVFIKLEKLVELDAKLEAVQKWCDYHAVPITAGATRASLKRLFKIMKSSEFKEDSD